MAQSYDYRNCQSLFCYAEKVHQRSGGICQLCGCGAGSKVDFDIWRQLTVEHLIGDSQKGYLKDIKLAVARRFPDLSPADVQQLASQIDEANTVSACSFCNSMTSRIKHSKTMLDLILDSPGNPVKAYQSIESELKSILQEKQDIVNWKLKSVQSAFTEFVQHQLDKARKTNSL